jgi:hypothetical protein
MIIIRVKRLHVSAMTLFPFIFIRTTVTDQQLPEYLNHEKIHITQQMEMLVIPFYIIYLIHYVVNYFKFRNHKKAYRNIIFEREAYAEEKNFDYLKRRRIWNFLRY